MIRNNQNRRRRGGNNNGPRPQQMNGGNNYGNRLDNRQRGNASQLLEKYRALARDAQQAGDRVTAEYYLQYADHYYRVLGDYRDKQPEQNRQRGREFYEDDSAGYNANGDDADNDDDGDDGDGRSDSRVDDSRDDGRREEPRSDSRDSRSDDNRGNWREDRPVRERQSREQAPREQQNREQPNRDQMNREQGSRDGNPPRREWNRNRDSGADADRPRNDPRNEQRSEQRSEQRTDSRSDTPRSDTSRTDAPRTDTSRPDAPRRERTERRPEPRAFEANVQNEGPIPGLPGPATLRMNRPVEASEAEMPAPRPARAPRRETASITPEVVAVPVESVGEDAAPRRRGRPRKVVADAATEG